MRNHLLNRITETEYDLSGRPRRIKTHENGTHLYTGEVTYDAQHGNLSAFTERVGSARAEYKTAFGYDAENRPTALNYGSTHDQSTVAYDGLGRVSGKSVKVNGHTYSTAFAFVPGAAAGKTTGLMCKAIAVQEMIVCISYFSKATKPSMLVPIYYGGKMLSSPLIRFGTVTWKNADIKPVDMIKEVLK